MNTLNTIEVGRRTEGQPIGVMLHGFGSCAENIAPLCNVFLDIVPYWLVLEAPVPMEALLGYPGPGFAWFPKQDDGYENEPNIQWHDLEGYDLPDMVEAALQVEETLREKDVFSSQVVLAGFSQGGMIATEVALQRTHALHKGVLANNAGENNYASLLLFSSAFLARVRRTALIQAATESHNVTLPTVLVCHGKSDEVLLYEQGQALHDFWKDYASYADFFGFNGSHEITDAVCEYITVFLNKVLHF